MRLLVVEDDADLSTVLVQGLREEEYAVDLATDGLDGLHRARSGEYDLIILDLMLPEIDGSEVLRRIRAEGSTVPVIILTARGEVSDRVNGLKGGADDYMPKPFCFDELLARVRAVLRRYHGHPGNDLCWSQLRMDLDGRRVYWADAEVTLSPREFQILEALLMQPDKVLSRTHIIEHAYDDSFDCDSNVIDSHVARLRRKLRDVTGLPIVETVRRVGYRVPQPPS
jgi:DNA-binding response OmpR family regulator